MRAVANDDVSDPTFLPAHINVSERGPYDRAVSSLKTKEEGSLLHCASSTCPYMAELADIMTDTASEGSFSWHEQRLTALLMLEKRAIEADAPESTQRAIRGARQLASYATMCAQLPPNLSVH